MGDYLVGSSPVGRYLVGSSPVGEYLIGSSPVGEYLVGSSPVGEYFIVHSRQCSGGKQQCVCLLHPVAADEMGLGKTLTMISLVLKNLPKEGKWREAGPASQGEGCICRYIANVKHVVNVSPSDHSRIDALFRHPCGVP